MLNLRTVGISFVFLSVTAIASTRVEEGIVKKVESITTQVGSDGKPILGATIGVGVGSMFGSGSGRDAAKIVGGLMGAKRQAQKKKQTLHGWRYIVEIAGELQVVDSWCDKPQASCSGYTKDTQVYVIDRKEVTSK